MNDRTQPKLELGQLILANDLPGVKKKGRPVIYTVAFVGTTMAKLVAHFGSMSAEIRLRGNTLPDDWEVLDNYSLAERLDNERNPPTPARAT